MSHPREIIDVISPLMESQEKAFPVNRSTATNRDIVRALFPTQSPEVIAAIEAECISLLTTICNGIHYERSNMRYETEDMVRALCVNAGRKGYYAGFRDGAMAVEDEMRERTEENA